MSEANESGGGAGAREDSDPRFTDGTGPEDPGVARAHLRALRHQVLESLVELAESVRRRRADARLSARAHAALGEAERSLRARVIELVDDVRWPSSQRDARVVLRMIEELSNLRGRESEAERERAAALLAELGAALRRPFLTDQEAGMD